MGVCVRSEAPARTLRVGAGGFFSPRRLCIPGLLLAVGTGPMALAQSVEPPGGVAVLLPGLAEGQQGLTVSGGFPWQGLRFQKGMHGGWTPVLEIESALLVRSSLSVGVAKTWIARPHFQAGGQVSLGVLLQSGLLEQRGPTVEASLTLAAPFRYVCPMLELSTRHTALLTSTQVETATDAHSALSVAAEWAPRATLGLGVPLGSRVALDAGLDLTWFGPGTVSIPGLHLGLSVGWGAAARARGGV